MIGYTEQELAVRRAAAKKIVEAAFSIRGRVLPDDEIERQAQHWEAAFSRVPTVELRNLYRIGLAHKCTTAAEFQNVWDMKTEAEAAAEAHRLFLAKRAEDESKTMPIPPHILAKWNGQSAAKAR